MNFLSISDIHLRSQNDERVQLLNSFMNHPLIDQVNNIFFLGDIFDLYIGHDEEYFNQFNLFFKETLRLLKLGKKIYYHVGKHECDFISGNLAIQVTDTLSEGNTKRELEGLIEAIDAYGLAGGIIITRDQEKEFTVGKGRTRKKITAVPAWKWCLETANIGKAHLV